MNEVTALNAKIRNKWDERFAGDAALIIERKLLVVRRLKIGSSGRI
jgi:hypothetical protein